MFFLVADRYSYVYLFIHKAVATVIRFFWCPFASSTQWSMNNKHSILTSDICILCVADWASHSDDIITESAVSPNENGNWTVPNQPKALSRLVSFIPNVQPKFQSTFFLMNSFDRTFFQSKKTLNNNNNNIQELIEFWNYHVNITWFTCRESLRWPT